MLIYRQKLTSLDAFDESLAASVLTLDSTFAGTNAGEDSFGIISPSILRLLQGPTQEDSVTAINIRAIHMELRLKTHETISDWGTDPGEGRYDLASEEEKLASLNVSAKSYRHATIMETCNLKVRLRG